MDHPVDFQALATEAVEGADALLDALEQDPDKQVIPDFEA
jgi:hypothetical protein